MAKWRGTMSAHKMRVLMGLYDSEHATQKALPDCTSERIADQGGCLEINLKPTV